MKILVVGAGISGLTTALCLSKSGHEVHLFEKANCFREIGAGLQVGANALNVLQYLGLEKALMKYSVLPEALSFRDGYTNQTLYQIDLGESYRETYGAPYLHIHRADLIKVLATQVSRSPHISVYFDSTAESLKEQKDHVQLRLSDSRLVEGELVVGADGIHSTIRDSLFNQTGTGREPLGMPKFSGNVAWRALIPVTLLPANFMPKIAINYVGPSQHLVLYYVRGGEFLNMVAVTQQRTWSDKSWVVDGDCNHLFDCFRAWHPNAVAAIQAVKEVGCSQWGLFDQKPFSPWHSDRIVVIGDAAHSTLPFMASGAALALEDARVLQRCLECDTNLPEALKRFERNRIARVSKVQTDSRRLGMLYHLPNRFLVRTAFSALQYLPGSKEDFLPLYNANEVVLP